MGYNPNQQLPSAWMLMQPQQQQDPIVDPNAPAPIGPQYAQDGQSHISPQDAETVREAFYSPHPTPNPTATSVPAQIQPMNKPSETIIPPQNMVDSKRVKKFKFGGK